MSLAWSPESPVQTPPTTPLYSVNLPWFPALVKVRYTFCEGSYKENIWINDIN